MQKLNEVNGVSEACAGVTLGHGQASACCLTSGAS